MDYGMPTLAEFNSIAESAALAKELGLSFVELNMNLPFCTVDALRAQNLPALARAYQIYFTLHADENLFFCDFNSRVAQAHLDTLLDAIDLCRETGIPLINFHMSAGVYFTLPDQKLYLFERYEDRYQESLLRFRDACQQAAGRDVALSIENTGLTHDFVLRGIDTLLSTPAFCLTWDVGHDCSAGWADSSFYLARKERIRHMHLHDAQGRRNHLSLGTGEINLTEKLSACAPERVVLEVKASADLRQSVAWLKSNLS